MSVAPQLAQPPCLKFLSSRNTNCLPCGLSYYSCVPPRSGKTRHPRRKRAIRKTARTNTARSGSQTPQPRVARSLDGELVDAEVAARAAVQAPVPRIFLLSPANARGIRAQLMLREGASFPLALKLRDGCLTLGEAFSFISGLYFRGKLAYARAFAHPPAGLSGAYVITTNQGFVPVETPVSAEELDSFSRDLIDAQNRNYSDPLVCTALAISAATSGDCPIVLLGSVASGKYTHHLLPIFGELLQFPLEFVGRGDMGRRGPFLF